MTTATTDQDPQGATRKRLLPFFPGLDGLRGVFAVVVLTYHANQGFPGALLAMTGFFVLSGFLITSLLLSEWMQTGGIRIGHFLANRARRILPPAIATLLFVAVFWTLLPLQDYGAVPVAEVQAYLRSEWFGALFYFNNWVRAFGPDWAGFGAVIITDGAEPSPVAHFWSLSVEEQFYLFYPLVLYGILRIGRSRAVFAAVVAVVFTGLWILAPTLDRLPVAESLAMMDRIYFGTDTRMLELLVGVGLGIVFSYAKARHWIQSSMVMTAVGALCMALLVYGWLTVSIGDSRLYNHGFVLVAVMFALVIASLTQPGGPFVAVMSLAPLRWLGERSYGLYLYHFPVQAWLDPAATGMSGWGLYAVRMSVTIVMAMVSYTFLEMPIRRRRRPDASWWWAVAGVTFLAAVFTWATL